MHEAQNGDLAPLPAIAVVEGVGCLLECVLEVSTGDELGSD